MSKTINMWRKPAKRIFKAVVAIVALAVVGCFSSLANRAKCEAHGMGEIVEAVSLPSGQKESVFLLPNHGQRSEAALKNAGLSVRECVATKENFDCFPWANVDSVVLPFIVAAKWECVAAPLSGQGDSALFFCLFGLSWQIQEQSLWVT
jgi:hypothetical protein